MECCPNHLLPSGRRLRGIRKELGKCQQRVVGEKDGRVPGGRRETEGVEEKVEGPVEGVVGKEAASKGE
eukprot:757273-Hanusia_phi.AAC.3